MDYSKETTSEPEIKTNQPESPKPNPQKSLNNRRDLLKKVGLGLLAAAIGARILQIKKQQDEEEVIGRLTEDGRFELAAKEPVPEIKETINGIEVRFLGVEHTPQYLQKHLDQIRDSIQKSAIVVLERFPYEQKEIEFDNFIATKPGLKNFLNDPQRLFFQEVVKLAEKRPGKVAMVDPISIPLNVTEGVRIGAAFYPLSEVIIDYLKYRKNQRQLSRRNFLKTTGKAAIAGSLLFGEGSFPNTIAQSLIGMKRHEKSSEIGYTEVDYRNVSIATGLDRLTSQSAGKIDGPITVIYGRAHIQQIATYLKDHETLRDVKQVGYRPLTLFGDQALRIYTFQNNSWALESRDNY